MDRSASSSAAPLQREKLAEAKRRLMALEQSVEESSSIPAPHAAAGSGLSGASDGSSRATSDLPGACDGIEGSGSGGWNSRGAAGMHDMLAGIDEMRRLQGAVETTFTVLHDVIKAQGAAIRALQKEVPGKASTAVIQQELAQKANVVDINQSLGDIAVALASKANAWEIETKADRADTERAWQAISAAEAQLQQVAHRESGPGDLSTHQLQLSISRLQADVEKLNADMRQNIADVRDEVRVGLQRKLDVEPFREKFRLGSDGGAQWQVARILSEKCDSEQMQRSEVQALAAKIDDLQGELKTHMLKTTSVRDTITLSGHDSMRKHAEAISALELAVARLQNVLPTHSGQAERSDPNLRAKLSDLRTEFLTKIESTCQNLSSEMDSLSQRLDTERQNTLMDLEMMRAHVASALDNKVSMVKSRMETHVRETVENMESALRHKVAEVQESLRAKADRQEIERSMEGMNASLTSKCEVLEEKLKVKTDSVSLALAGQDQTLKKVSAVFSESVRNVIVKLQSVEKEMNSRAGKDETERNLERLQALLTDTSRALAGKAAIDDMNSILEGKADIDEVNKALLEINNQVAGKLSIADVGESLNTHTLMKAALVADLSVGRWVWNTRATKAAGAIAWNLQTANSDPGNLIWDQGDKTVIICNKAGLYEIQFGFFSRNPPRVSVQVNGDAVLTVCGAPNNWPIQQHVPKTGVVSSGRYTGSYITGLTHIDFLVMPAKAKVSFRYQGDVDTEGFVCLRKV